MHLPLRRVLACAATAALAAGGLAATSAHAAAAAPAKRLVDDFNGDGYGDVVLNLPFHSPLTRNKSGAVMVLYGSASGLSSSHRKLITQNTAGVPGTAESTDWFGHATTTGDFDGDGYADLAVSAYGEDYSAGGTSWSNVGQVTMIWGGPDGLTYHGATTVELGTPAVQSLLAGQDLASGDFNGDGKRDLAVGYGHGGEAGSVLFGPIDRTGTPASRKPLGLTGLPSSADVMLAPGDLTGDGVTDLLVSWDTMTLGNTDKIHVLRGGVDGFTDIGYLKNSSGAQLYHRQGERLVTGDIDKDGHDDVIVPQPFMVDHKGEFLVVYGGANGQDPTRKPLHIDQDTPGVPDTNSDAGVDNFGAQLAVADVNGDGYPDVIAASPNENHSHLTDAGKVTVLPGGPDGVTGRGATAFTQNTSGVPGSALQYGGFGAGIKATDVNGDGRTDTLIGVNGVDATGISAHTGGLWMLPGSATGTTATGSKAFSPTGLGLPGDADLYLGQSFNR
ncbi:hypothetical protein GCM10011579_074640 [Streptomyces albiflavescens]|uniref:Integrin n=1 Tax=Streptomyces albiflavescens TaxID=1623582 RepID=A0A917YD99_9ACTN|nr:FG-GAP-like repeat-containing protein [Streptomyces albiflavescens]GGN84571.1 hypothetical protein GCM10011579_074640 [Streptomyces albiflavescens]